MSEGLLTPEQLAARLMRSRAWHLREAGRQRFVAQQAVAAAVQQTQLHDEAVGEIDAELARLGRPQPPFTPRVA